MTPRPEDFVSDVDFYDRVDALEAAALRAQNPDGE